MKDIAIPQIGDCWKSIHAAKMFPLLAGRGVPQFAGGRSNPVIKIDCHGLTPQIAGQPSQ